MVSLVSRTGRQFQRYTNKGGRQVVGCIPYRYGNSDNDLEVLVISSQKGGQAMLFPKGGWEIDESMEEAASRESLEEAGVRGKVEGKLGKWNFMSKRYDILYEGYMFPLLVKEQLDSWPEKDVRTRKWITITEAREICQHPWMKEALERLIVRKTTSLTSSQQQIFEEEEEDDEECEDVLSLSPCSL